MKDAIDDREWGTKINRNSVELVLGKTYHYEDKNHAWMKTI